MREINQNEIQFISGGLGFGTLVDVASACVGGYFGSSLAYIEPLMNMTTAPTGLIATYTPSLWILIPGIMLGASIGYVVSNGLQKAYYS